MTISNISSVYKQEFIYTNPHVAMKWLCTSTNIPMSTITFPTSVYLSSAKTIRYSASPLCKSMTETPCFRWCASVSIAWQLKLFIHLTSKVHLPAAVPAISLHQDWLLPSRFSLCSTHRLELASLDSYWKHLSDTLQSRLKTFLFNLAFSH